MKKTRNSDYKPPKDVYVNDFYSRQLEDIKGYLLRILLILTLILLAIAFK